MTLFKPALFLQRLVIVRHGLTVYDQVFHTGVNIIRGTNSHGKSTIANFIFYVLGGDVSRWTPEAETCDFVFAAFWESCQLEACRKSASSNPKTRIDKLEFN